MKALLTILLLLTGAAYGQSHLLLRPAGSGPLCYTVYPGHYIRIQGDTIHSESVDTLYVNGGGDSLVWWNRYGRHANKLPAGSGGSATTDASLLTSGTLNDARLSSNVVNLTGTQTLTNKTLSQSSITGLVSALAGKMAPADTVNTYLRLLAGQNVALTGTFPNKAIAVTPVGLDGYMLYNNGNVITSSDLAFNQGTASMTFTGIANLGTIRTNIPSGSSSTVMKFGSVASNVWKVDANGTVYDIATATTPAFTALTDASTVTWSYNRYTSFNASVTIAGNRSLSLSGDADGNYGTIAVTQDGSGGRTFTLPGGDNTTNVNVTTGAGSKSIYTWLKIGSVRYWNGKTY